MALAAPSVTKLLPTDVAKTTTIRALTPNLTITNLPFKVGGIVKVGGRATICRLQTGALAVFSPTPLTPAVEAAVDAMGGQLRYIVAINIVHHLFIGQWKQRYPDAKVIGPAGLPEKRARDQEIEPVAFDVVIGDECSSGAGVPLRRKYKVDEEFDANFSVEFLATHFNRELVFGFIREKTLIEGDVWLNIPALEQYSASDEDPRTGVMTRFIAHVNQAPGDSLTGRIKWYAFTVGKTESLAKSVRAIDQWPFERIVPCHGEVVEVSAKSKFRSIFPKNYLEEM